jgi:hypothetical protein
MEFMDGYMWCPGGPWIMAICIIQIQLTMGTRIFAGLASLVHITDVFIRNTSVSA